MNIVNNFRYGEISKKTAGRFDSEFYQQACFSFRNMVSHPEGDASRRPPVKKLLDLDEKILALRDFTVSESLSYIVGLGETKLFIMRKVAGEMQIITSAEYPHGISENAIKLDSKKASEVRTAQYYRRLYFVHHTFRPFYIDMNSDDSFSVSIMTVLLNQYAKNAYWFTPSYIEDSNGNELPDLEKRFVYMRDDGTWWFDSAMENEKYEYALSYPPIKGKNAYIYGYETYPDDDLLEGYGNFPSVISIVNDSLYLAATDLNPHVIWKSRVLGTSQFIDGYIADSMHDFIQFQVITTETKETTSDLPTVDMTDSSGNVIYEQSGGIDNWYIKDDDGERRVYWRPYEYVFYTDSGLETKYDTSLGYPVSKDGGATWYKPTKDSSGNYTWADADRLYYEKITVTGDKKFYLDDQYTTPYTGTAEPYRKAMKMYDLTNASKLMKSVTELTFIGNDSCATRFGLATGRQDRIMHITPACEKIIVCSSMSEHTLPATFSAIDNKKADHYSDHGSSLSYSVNGVVLDSSFLFIQKNNLLREFYMYEGFMMRNEITAMNHDILSGNIIQMVAKNTPEPIVYFVMDDGTMRIVSYDKTNQIQSFSRWDMNRNTGRKFISIAKLEENNSSILIAVIEESDGSQWIGYFDEEEKEQFADEGGDDYISEIETTYSEIYDDSLWFGSFKKANRAVIRPYNTGYILVGGDERQLVKTNYRLGSDDYVMAVLGNSMHKSTMIIRAFGSDPMDILAFGFDMTR